jgi:hypothetical protein
MLGLQRLLEEGGFMRRRRIKMASVLVVASLLVFVGCRVAEAQSGRRAPKATSPSPTVAPTPEPEQAQPARAKTPAQPQIPLLILGNISSDISFSIPAPERMQEWVAKRLRDSSALAVSGGEMVSRKEAINRAKAAKEGFIIYLQFDQLGISTTPGGARPNFDDMRINYSVLAPETGKAKASGVVYLNERSTLVGIGRGRNIPVCYPGVSADDYKLIQASLEVAARIMSALGVSAPPVCS